MIIAIVALVVMLLTTATYYVYGITQVTSILILLVIPVIVVLWRKYIRSDELSLQAKFVSPTPTDFVATQSVTPLSHFSFPISVFLLESFLFFTLFTHQTTDLMPSPWQAVGPWFFFTYAAATGVLFWIVAHCCRDEALPRLYSVFVLTSLHLFLTWSITSILYPLGWGFDAFVHRATESWIATHGYILPKLPYYIGQYSFVAWLHNITGISIYWLDVLLVPISASLLLPPTVYYSLRSAFNLPAKVAALSVWLIPFVPFLSLNLTTPHNVVLLLTIAFVFTLLKSGVTCGDAPNNLPLLLGAGGGVRYNAGMLALIGLAAMITHPLIGVPLFITSIFAIIYQKTKKKKTILVALFISVALAAPALFTLNNLRVGAGWPTFSNPLTNITHFLELFERPYWYLDHAPLVFEILYGWERMIVPVVVGLAVLGMFSYVRSNARPKGSAFNASVERTPLESCVTPILLTVSLALFTSGWLLRSWLVFPDVVAYEQGDFPLRLIKASIIFILPFSMYGLYILIEKMKSKSKTIAYCLLPIASILLMLSLYISYPQRNIKARFPGFNVTVSDFKAVEWIHNRHESDNYIVLSNQLVSAAALTNYSFAKYFNTSEGQIFYYALPTGGPQYQDYGRMLYEGQKREHMLSAMDRVGVNTGYFVVNKYWANSDKIIEGAKLSADDWEVIDDGKVWVFIYKR